MATEYSDPRPQPKYWSMEDSCIKYGLRRCPDFVSLESLCGKYSWVFLEGDENTEYDYEAEMEQEDPDPGFLTLSFPSGKDHSLQNLTGCFRLWELKGSFRGVSESFFNYWEIDKLDWDECPEGHLLKVSDLHDDNGNRFIAFVMDEGWVGCAPRSSTSIAKKQTDENTFVGLTDSERERMGMYIEDEELKKKANVKKKKKKVGVKGRNGRKRKLDVEEHDTKFKVEEGSGVKKEDTKFKVEEGSGKLDVEEQNTKFKLEEESDLEGQVAKRRRKV